MIGERFTREAREAVHQAVREAQRLRAPAVGPEHLLLAVFGELDALGFEVDRAEVEAAFATARRKGGLTEADTEALRGLGIDVDLVVASVEGAHGEGALAVAPPRRKRLFGLPFEPASRKVLERALVEVRDLRHGYLGAEHLVLALAAGGGVVGEVLGARGVDYVEVRTRVANRPR
ncbi:Clp protease N-terminal domain-containing protein [Actinosynnema sp. NPDC020468]|uniref:Clp protease N-terminal domain-containing protein n=1 Tax=Actinosynnema sp. NPDC020468 TaxID=3154488 RepID=UPI0033C25335